MIFKSSKHEQINVPIVYKQYKKLANNIVTLWSCASRLAPCCSKTIAASELFTEADQCKAVLPAKKKKIKLKTGISLLHGLKSCTIDAAERQIMIWKHLIINHHQQQNSNHLRHKMIVYLLCMKHMNGKLRNSYRKCFDRYCVASPYSSVAFTSASAFINSSTMPSMARRAAKIIGVVPSCIRAFKLVERFLSKICNAWSEYIYILLHISSVLSKTFYT